MVYKIIIFSFLFATLDEYAAQTVARRVHNFINNLYTWWGRSSPWWNISQRRITHFGGYANGIHNNTCNPDTHIIDLYSLYHQLKPDKYVLSIRPMALWHIIYTWPLYTVQIHKLSEYPLYIHWLLYTTNLLRPCSWTQEHGGALKWTEHTSYSPEMLFKGD